MKIPDAYFSGGFGRRVPRLQAGPSPDASGSEAIANAGQRLGGALTGLGTGMLAEQSRRDLEQAQERERMRRVQQKSEATLALFEHENTLTASAKLIADDASLPPEEKRTQFRQLADQTKSRFLQSVPEEYQFSFAPTFEGHRQQAGEYLETAIGKQMQSSARGNLFASMEALERSPKALGEKLLLLRDIPDEVWSGAGIDADSRSAEIQKRAELMTEADLDTQLNSKDPRQVLAELRATRGEGGEFANFADLSPKSRQAYIRATRSLIEAQDHEAERQRKEARVERDRQAKEAFDNYKELREGLFAIDPKQEAGFWKLVSGTEYEDKAREVRRTTGALGFVAGKVKSDPLKYGAAQLGLDVPPLSVDNPSDWPAQLAARGQVAGIIKEQHGLPYMPVLTNGEAEGLAGLFKTQAPQAQANTLAGLRQGLGPDSLRQVARQMAAQDADLGTVVGLAAEGKDKAAYHVAAGRRLLEEKAAPMPKPLADDLRGRFDDQMGNALAGMPQARESMFRAVQAAYISLAGAGQVLDERIEKPLFDQALQLVAGGTAKVNGKRVLLPADLTEEQFLTNVRRIGPAQIETGGGVSGFKSAAEAAAAIRDDAELWEAGAGRYRFAIDGRFLLTADGAKPLELDLSDQSGQRFKIGN